MEHGIMTASGHRRMPAARDRKTGGGEGKVSFMEAAEEDRYTLQSVDNALRILQCLCVGEELGVTEVAKQVEIGKSSAFRLLATLERRNFVAKSPEGKYRLGMKLASIGEVVLNRMEIIRFVHPYLKRMTDRSLETTHLVTLCTDTQVQFIDKVSSPSSIRMDSRIGLRRTAHVTATGKMLLAWQNDRFLTSYAEEADFHARTPFTITDPARLDEELRAVRANGYAADVDESEVGLTCYAAPIVNLCQKAIAAISISGPSERMQAKRETLIRMVADTAREISGALKA